MFKSLRRSLLVLVLAVCFGTPAAQGSPWVSMDLSNLWRQFGVFMGTVGVHAKHGCSIDPDGLSTCLNGSEVSKRGCKNGTSCSSSPLAKHGCSIDPNGNTVCKP